MSARLCACAALLLASSCGAESVTLAIDFPSERSFILTETAEVLLIEAETCSEALVHATSDPERSLRRITGSSCDLRGGDLVIDSVPRRSVAFVVLAFQSEVSRTEPILRGCRIVAAGSSPALVAITLDFTDDYFPYESAVLAGGGPGCASADELCAGTCTP
jgi:hypothetical protein